MCVTEGVVVHIRIKTVCNIIIILYILSPEGQGAPGTCPNKFGLVFIIEMFFLVPTQL